MSEVHSAGNAKESALHEESGDVKPPDVHTNVQDETNSPSEGADHMTCGSPGDVPSADLPACTTEANLESPKMEEVAQTSPDACLEAAAKGCSEAVDHKSCEDTEEKKVVHSQEETSKNSVEQSSDRPEVQELNGLSPESAKEDSVGMQKLDSLAQSSVDLVAPNANVGLGNEVSVERATEPLEAHIDLSVERATEPQEAHIDLSVEGATEPQETHIDLSNESATEPVTDDVKDKTVAAPALCSSSAESPSDSCKEVSPSEPSVPTVCDSTVATSKDEKPVLDFTKETVAVSDSVCNLEGENHEGDKDASGEVSVDQDASGADQDCGREAAADSLGSPGNLGSDQEEPDEGLELHPDVSKDDLDEDSGINDGIRGLEDDELDDDLDEEEEYCLKGERQQGDGQESVDPSDVQDKVLDFDEDKRNPQYIPKKGAFYQHDDRLVGDEDESEIPEEKNEDDKGTRRQKKLWHDEGVWGHDMYREEEQAPKTSEELVSIYGYDIRSETMPPRARRRRRYGRGPNKYQRNWEDEEAYTPRSGSGRGGGIRGGRRPRGSGQVGNPSFRDEDFPDLNAKRSESESSAPLHQDKAEVKAPTKPVASKNSDHGTPDNSSPQQGEWEHVAKSSGTARRGWGKRPSQPPRRLTDTSPKQQEDEVKENVSSGHRACKPAPQSPLKTAESSHNPPSVGKSRAVRHVLTEQERSRRNAEIPEKTVPKVELQDGGAADLTKNSGTTVAPRGGPVGGTEVAGKPRRYSSLRQRPLAEAAPYTEATVVAPQLPNAQAPPPGPSQPQPAILTAAHFQGPYAPYPDDYMLPPAQAPPVMPPPSQPPPPVMAPPAQISSPFLPPPGGILSFPPQYPPPYTFPTQYAAPAPAAPPPAQTQAQKPPYYHGDIIYYNTQSQQHKQRPTPPRRPKAAIPIVPPPESHGTVQEGTSEADGSASHQSKSDEDPDDSGVVVTEPALQESLAAQQVVEGL